MKVDKHAEPTNLPSSRLSGRQAKRTEVFDSVRTIATALNSMYDNEKRYRRAIVNSKTAS